VAEDEAFLLGEIAATDVFVEVATEFQEVADGPDGLNENAVDAGKFVIEEQAEFFAERRGVFAIFEGDIGIELGIEITGREDAAFDDLGIDEIHRERTGGHAVGIGDPDGTNEGTGEFEDGFEDLQAFIGIGNGEFVEEKEGVDGIDASEEEELGEAIRGIGLLGVVLFFNGGIIDDARS